MQWSCTGFSFPWKLIPKKLYSYKSSVEVYWIAYAVALAGKRCLGARILSSTLRSNALWLETRERLNITVCGVFVQSRARVLLTYWLFSRLGDNHGSFSVRHLSLRQPQDRSSFEAFVCLNFSRFSVSPTTRSLYCSNNLAVVTCFSSAFTRHFTSQPCNRQ